MRGYREVDEEEKTKDYLIRHCFWDNRNPLRNMRMCMLAKK